MDIKPIIKGILWFVLIIGWLYICSHFEKGAIHSEEDISNLPPDEIMRYEQMIF